MNILSEKKTLSKQSLKIFKQLRDEEFPQNMDLNKDFVITSYVKPLNSTNAEVKVDSEAGTESEKSSSKLTKKLPQRKLGIPIRRKCTQSIDQYVDFAYFTYFNLK